MKDNHLPWVVPETGSMSLGIFVTCQKDALLKGDWNLWLAKVRRWPWATLASAAKRSQTSSPSSWRNIPARTSSETLNSEIVSESSELAFEAEGTNPTLAPTSSIASSRTSSSGLSFAALADFYAGFPLKSCPYSTQ